MDGLQSHEQSVQSIIKTVFEQELGDTSLAPFVETGEILAIDPSNNQDLGTHYKSNTNGAVTVAYVGSEFDNTGNNSSIPTHHLFYEIRLYMKTRYEDLPAKQIGLLKAIEIVQKTAYHRTAEDTSDRHTMKISGCQVLPTPSLYSKMWMAVIQAEVIITHGTL